MLVRNINSGVFEPKYSPNYRIIAIHGNNHIAVKAPDCKIQVWHRGHIKKIDPVDKVISLLPSTEDYQKFGRETKLLIHPDNIPDTNISLPSKKEAETMSREGENSKNYSVSCEKSNASKNIAVNVEMLNCIHCSTEWSKTPEISKTLNQVNASLISAACHVPEETPGVESGNMQRENGMVWNKLTKFLSNKSVMKVNKNSGFSFFL